MDVATASRSNGRLAAWISVVLVAAVLAFGANLFGDVDVPDEPLYDWSFFFGSTFGLALFLGAALLIAIGTPRLELFALRRPRSWWRAIGIAVAVLAVTLAVGGVLSRYLNPAREQGLLPETWPPPDIVAFAFNVMAVVAGAAIAEEVLFRGLGYTLLERFGARVAVAGSAIGWTLAHGLLQAFPLLLVLGLGLGVLRRSTGSIIPGLVLHATFNAIAIVGAAAGAMDKA